MNDLDDVAGLHLDGRMLAPGHDLSIALDGHRTVRQPEVLDQCSQRQPRRYFVDFAVDGQIHGLYVGPRIQSCQ